MPTYISNFPYLSLFRLYFELHSDIDKPVTFITTFETPSDKSSQFAKTKSVKVTDSEGVLVEEVVSDTETTVRDEREDVSIEEIEGNISMKCNFLNYVLGKLYYTSKHLYEFS